MTIRKEDALRTSYEWVIETVTADAHEDVLDLEHDTALGDFRWCFLEAALRQDRFDSEVGPCFTRVCLKRDRYSNAEGCVDSQYAYVVDGKLDALFDEGAKVPKRFHAELARNLPKE